MENKVPDLRRWPGTIPHKVEQWDGVTVPDGCGLVMGYELVLRLKKKGTIASKKRLRIRCSGEISSCGNLPLFDRPRYGTKRSNL